MLLANRFGLGSPYGCDMFLYGPRSEALYDDCLAPSRGRAGLYDGVKASVPGSFDREGFERLVRGRELYWLIAASKFAELRPYRDTRESLMDIMLGCRPEYTEEYVSGVLGELERAGLISAY